MSTAGDATGRINRINKLAANPMGVPATNAAADGFRAASRSDTTQNAGGHDAVRHCRGTGEGVWTATGQTDDGHLVDPENVCNGSHVVGELKNRLVLMRRRRTDTGPVDADQSDVLALREDPGLGRDLTAGTRISVQPEDGAALGVAELSKADLAILTD